MISVAQALDHIFDLVPTIDCETVELASSSGRVLAETVEAARDQPPYATSAMDGYAVLENDVRPGSVLNVIGESAAGRPFQGCAGPGAAIRIFTGARVPEGAERVVIQEDVTAAGGTITVRDGIDSNRYIRPAGGDYGAGSRVPAPRVLRPSTLSLIASMNVGKVSVYRKPDIAIIPTGDELSMPGDPDSDQKIIASSGLGIAAILESAGATPRIMPIARDRADSIEAGFHLASDADMIVTVGGASEGDHDLVRPVAERMGLRLFFYKLAMRPGKPLMAGVFHEKPVIGLPGNPVSALVCSYVILVPAVRAMLGLGRSALPRKRAPLAERIPSNGPREHYMRAVFQGPDNEISLRIFNRQDSSLMSVLDQADALVVRPPGDPERKEGELVEYCELGAW